MIICFFLLFSNYSTYGFSIMRWVGHVARMGEERGLYRVVVGKPEGRNHWGDLGVDGG